MLAPLLGHPLRGRLPSVVGGYHEKWPIRASMRPLDIYIYVFGSQSCATRLIFAGSAPLRPRPWPRMAPLVEFGAVLGVSASHTSSDRLRRLGLRPRVIPRSLRRRSRRLRGDTRRNASSAEYRAAPCGPCGVRASRSGNPTASRRAHSSPCDVSHRASDEPRRCMSLSSALAPSSLASPSLRRVFLRSFCGGAANPPRRLSSPQHTP